MEVIIDGEVTYTETTACPLPPVETTTTTTTVVPPSTLPVTGGGDIVGTSLELTDLAPIAVVLVGLGVVLLGLGLGVQASREAT